MEVFVEFELSCENARSAELMTRLLQNFSQDIPENETVSSLDEFGLDSKQLSVLEKLVGKHRENLGCLETAEADDKVFRATFVCGRGAEKFLVGLAKASAVFKASITRLTARYDEGVYVCDLVDGKPHLEEFEDYEAYQQTGFVESDNASHPFESVSDSLQEDHSAKSEKDVRQPSVDAEEFTEQSRTILSIARKYHEDSFAGIPLDFDEWYSDEYHATGWLEWLESPEAAAKTNQEWADSHDGVKSMEFKIKGQIEGLVSIDTQITLNDGYVKESNSCWILQNDRWKMHNSCARILTATRDISDEELAALKELEDLFTQSPVK